MSSSQHRLVHFVGGPLGGLVKWTDEWEWHDVRRIPDSPSGWSFRFVCTIYREEPTKHVTLAILKSTQVTPEMILTARTRQHPKFLEQARLALFDELDLPADDMSDVEVLNAYNKHIEGSLCPFTSRVNEMTDRVTFGEDVRAGDIVYEAISNKWYLAGAGRMWAGAPMAVVINPAKAGQKGRVKRSTGTDSTLLKFGDFLNAPLNVVNAYNNKINDMITSMMDKMSEADMATWRREDAGFGD